MGFGNSSPSAFQLAMKSRSEGIEIVKTTVYDRILQGVRQFSDRSYGKRFSMPSKRFLFWSIGGAIALFAGVQLVLSIRTIGNKTSTSTVAVDQTTMNIRQTKAVYDEMRISHIRDFLQELLDKGNSYLYAIESTPANRSSTSRRSTTHTAPPTQPQELDDLYKSNGYKPNIQQMSEEELEEYREDVYLLDRDNREIIIVK